MEKSLFIRDNAALTTLSGFPLLQHIGKSLSIKFNDLLATVSGFGSLTSLGNAILIQNNALLSSCCGLIGIINEPETPKGATIISDNAAGCSSTDQIKADCPAPPPPPPPTTTPPPTPNPPPPTTTTPTTPPPSSSPVVGIPALAKSLRFYPNPASHTLYIEGIRQETSLLIRTLSGKTLLRTTLHQNQAIDLASLPQGVYLLTLQSGQENAQEQSQEQSQEQRTGRLVIGL